MYDAAARSPHVEYDRDKHLRMKCCMVERSPPERRLTINASVTNSAVLNPVSFESDQRLVEPIAHPRSSRIDNALQDNECRQRTMNVDNGQLE